MEIGWPTEVRHVAHVTFDRFHGFLGLPSEFESHVPARVPGASTSVFGVSTKSLQCSYDTRGNSVPTILLMMQRCLYARGGLQVEGIFRITADNTQEEYVRDRLNHGIVPDNIDVHCLAGLIKAWFRELPNGVLDALTPEHVMQCEIEEDYVNLLHFIGPAEASILDWAVNLMADVVQEEHHNKMNPHNVATVFAPNMTQMADPLNALMHAVQVMNFLKTLIVRTLRLRQNAKVDNMPASKSETSCLNGRHGSSELNTETSNEAETESIAMKGPLPQGPFHFHEKNSNMDNTLHIPADAGTSGYNSYLTDNPSCIPKEIDILVLGSKVETDPKTF